MYKGREGLQSNHVNLLVNSTTTPIMICMISAIPRVAMARQSPSNEARGGRPKMATRSRDDTTNKPLRGKSSAGVTSAPVTDSLRIEIHRYETSLSKCKCPRNQEPDEN